MGPVKGNNITFQAQSEPLLGVGLYTSPSLNFLFCIVVAHKEREITKA